MSTLSHATAALLYLIQAAQQYEYTGFLDVALLFRIFLEDRFYNLQTYDFKLEFMT
jgi:hypothetical protein